MGGGRVWRLTVGRMGYSEIRYEVRGDVGIITIDRPEARNALTFTTYRELEDAVRSTTARCLVITGADPAFCSGDDVAEIMAAPGGGIAGRGAAIVHNPPTPAAIAALDCAKPVIAAVNGAAIGWGCELALFADLRIASDRAKFSEMFVKRGLSCDVGGFYRLPALVGPEKAAELLFTGDVIDAAEALRIGLVGRVVAHADLLGEARALATRIAANPPLAVRALKAGLRRTCFGDPREIGGWAIDTIRRLAHTDDHREGVASFLEKRPAVFQGL
jgi:enoyl-CoA hydratase/carnithine racemase